MNNISLIFGCIVTLIGLLIAVLTLVFLHTNRVRNIITGVVFVFIGLVIVWGSQHNGSIIHINLGISDEFTGLLLAGFVISLFFLKGLLDIREGSQRLGDKSLSFTKTILSRFQIIVGIIIITCFCLIVFLLISQIVR